LQLLTRAIDPHVVPVCYISVEDVFYTASDIGTKIVPPHRPMIDNRQRPNTTNLELHEAKCISFYMLVKPA
jgi:hypothetical protein